MEHILESKAMLLDVCMNDVPGHYILELDEALNCEVSTN
jgi:hypothetical protein